MASPTFETTMRYSPAVERLSQLGGDSWAPHWRARALIAEGQDIVEFTIGEPDVPTPDYLLAATEKALRAGRTGYARAAGEPGLREALAARYTRQIGRPIAPEQVLCLPGTQTSLQIALSTMASEGDAVLVGDPMYATYPLIAAATGVDMISVPLRAENGFRIRAADIAERITDRTRVIFLNTPHNPTGAVLTADDIDAIGKLATAHDLWLLVDEVYDEMIFGNRAHVSPLARPDLAERTVVVSSISKSHAAPGLRSGWCVGSVEFVERALPLAQAMLFGNQPFIADATAVAVSQPSPVAAGMRERFEARACRLMERLHAETPYRMHMPESGMFALVDVTASGLDGDAFAVDLLAKAGVSVMPGSAFGAPLKGWIRLALTQPDERFDEGVKRIVDYARS